MHAAPGRAEAAAEVGGSRWGAVVVDAAGALLAVSATRGGCVPRATRRSTRSGAHTSAGTLAARGAPRFYVTLEPYSTPALVNARVARVVYGCADPKAGAVDTLFAIGAETRA